MRTKKGRIRAVAALLIVSLLLPAAVAYADMQKINVSGYPLKGFDRSYTGLVTGQKFTGSTEKMFINGEVAFCIQSGYGIPGFTPAGGDVELEYDVQKIAEADSLQNKIAYLGWYDSAEKTDRDYAFTQMYIWQSLPDMPVSGNASVRFEEKSLRRDYEEWKEEIDEAIAAWSEKPSFAYDGGQNVIAIRAGESRKLADSNGALRYYGAFSYTKEGVTVEHRQGEDFLLVSAAVALDTGTVVMDKGSLQAAGCQKYAKEAPSAFLYESEVAQDMATYGAVTPLGMELRFAVEGLQAEIRIVKKDAESGRAIPLAGTAFMLTDLATGEQIAGPAAEGCFLTDEEGVIELPEPLRYGKYRLTERRAPHSYLLAAPLDFTVDGSSKLLELTVFDEVQKGQLSLLKRGETLVSIRKNEDGTYTPVFAETAAAGAEFELRAAEDIITPDGTVHLRKGELAARLTSGEDGRAVSGLLYLGKYQLQETKAAFGHVRDEQIYDVELTYAGQEVEVAGQELTLSNERQRARISFYKDIEEEQLFSLSAADACADMTFGLFAAEEITAPDGSILPAGGLLAVSGVEQTDDGFRGEFAADIPAGRFYVQELSTNEHYVLNGERYPLEFQYQEDGEAVAELIVNAGKPIANELIRGSIAGYKTGDGGQALAGAVFALFARDEESLTAENALMTAASDEKGEFFFADVPYGDWLIREISAPAGHLLSEQSFFVHVGEDGAVVEIEAANEPKIGYAEFFHQAGRSGSIVFFPPKMSDEAGGLAYAKILAAAALAVWAALALFYARSRRRREK